MLGVSSYASFTLEFRTNVIQNDKFARAKPMQYHFPIRTFSPTSAKERLTHLAVQTNIQLFGPCTKLFELQLFEARAR
jgi:hypothetical protein